MLLATGKALRIVRKPEPRVVKVPLPEVDRERLGDAREYALRAFIRAREAAVKLKNGTATDGQRQALQKDFPSHGDGELAREVLSWVVGNANEVAKIGKTEEGEDPWTPFLKAVDEEKQLAERHLELLNKAADHRQRKEESKPPPPIVGQLRSRDPHTLDLYRRGEGAFSRAKNPGAQGELAQLQETAGQAHHDALLAELRARYEDESVSWATKAKSSDASKLEELVLTRSARAIDSRRFRRAFQDCLELIGGHAVYRDGNKILKVRLAKGKDDREAALGAARVLALRALRRAIQAAHELRTRQIKREALQGEFAGETRYEIAQTIINWARAENERAKGSLVSANDEPAKKFVEKLDKLDVQREAQLDQLIAELLKLELDNG